MLLSSGTKFNVKKQSNKTNAHGQSKASLRSVLLAGDLQRWPQLIMKIRSSDPKFFIELISDNYDGVYFMEVKAKFGDFGGRNDSVHLENLPEFVNELDEFISDRSKTPELVGTYGFRLTFFANTPAGRPRVRCNLGNTVCHPEGNRDFGVYGEFEIDTEYLNQYLKEFRELCRPYLGNGQQ